MKCLGNTYNKFVSLLFANRKQYATESFIDVGHCLSFVIMQASELISNSKTHSIFYIIKL